MKKVVSFLLILCLILGYAALAESTAPSQATDEPQHNVFDPTLYEGKLAVWFFSLPGKEHTGESMLIRTPEGKYMLIDGGTAAVGPLISSYLDQIGVEEIEILLATHMHADHVGGLPTVMEKYPVGVLYSSPFMGVDAERNTDSVNDLIAAANAHGLTLEPLLAGDTFQIGTAIGTVLYPFETPEVPADPYASDGNFINDTSVVFRLDYGEIRILFTADATYMAEMKIMEVYDGEQLQADVIKVPHHGASNASFRKYVNMVDAKESVMCFYMIENYTVYNRYEKEGKRPWHTGIDGTILLVTDGESIAVYSELERDGILK